MVSRDRLVYLSLFGLLLGLANAWPKPQEEEEDEEVEQVEEKDDSIYYVETDGLEDVGLYVTIDDIDLWNLGLLPLSEEQPLDEDSVEYFRTAALQPTPDSFSAVEMGWVTPVKSQGQCGSCVAFASMAVIEVCLARVTERLVTYSEQQLIDCARSFENAYGCQGADYNSYLKWAQEKNNIFALSEDYQNLNNNISQVCHADSAQLMVADAIVNSTHFEPNGNEEILKSMVANFGAALTTIRYTNATLNRLRAYTSGIFECTPEDLTDPGPGGHAMAVVGYGTENDVDYWLLKNSWGTAKGEEGYVRFIRGKEACGIGKQIATSHCISVLECKDEHCAKLSLGYDKEVDEVKIE